MKIQVLSIFIGVSVCLVAGFFVMQSYRSKTISFASQEGGTESESFPDISVDVDRTESVGTPPKETDHGTAVEQKTSTVEPSNDTIIDTSIPETSQKAVSKKTSTSLKFSISEKRVAFGFVVPSKPRTIDTIILHSSYDAVGSDPYSVSGVIAVWKEYGVAPHYLIDRNGHIYRLVKDENIAYHAGVSKMPDGRANVNDFSIGIEILNTKTDKYTDAQYAAVKKLIGNLKEEYAIKYVLGHDDIAPGRKTDPWNFEWKKL